MPFNPKVNDTLTIDSAAYRIAEHPAAHGMPYGQEGRQAVVYQVVAENGDKRALKVFKARYRVPGLVSISQRLADFAELPGLEVCRRTVLTPQRHADLLRQHVDLTYAVLMPWVEGPTWMQVVLDKEPMTAEQSLALARVFANVLARMEQENLAHCDLSASNLLLPMLAGGEGLALVDVEQMYGPDLRRPHAVPGGSPGYAHKTAPDGLWSLDADRFAGAVMLAEMLGWCDQRVRDAAWGENYFAPDEMQTECERIGLLVSVLRERWGEDPAGLLEAAWQSGTLADCATFGDWLIAIMRCGLNGTPAPQPVLADPTSGWEALNRGDWQYALALFGEMAAQGKFREAANRGIAKARELAEKHRNAERFYTGALDAMRKEAWGAAEVLVDQSMAVLPDAERYQRLKDAIAGRRNVYLEIEAHRTQALEAFQQRNWRQSIEACVEGLAWLPDDTVLTDTLSKVRKILDEERQVREAKDRSNRQVSETRAQAETTGSRMDWEIALRSAREALQLDPANVTSIRAAEEAEKQLAWASAIEQAQKAAGEERWDEVLGLIISVPEGHARASELRTTATFEIDRAKKIHECAEAAQRAMQNEDWPTLKAAAESALSIGAAGSDFSGLLEKADDEITRDENALLASRQAVDMAELGDWDHALLAIDHALDIRPGVEKYARVRQDIKQRKFVSERLAEAKSAATEGEWERVLISLRDVPGENIKAQALVVQAQSELARQQGLRECNERIATEGEAGNWDNVVSACERALSLGGSAARYNLALEEARNRATSQTEAASLAEEAATLAGQEIWDIALEKLAGAIAFWPDNQEYRALEAKYSRENELAHTIELVRETVTAAEWEQALVLLESLPEDYRDTSALRTAAERGFQVARQIADGKAAVKQSLARHDLTGVDDLSASLMALAPADEEVQGLAAQATEMRQHHQEALDLAAEAARLAEQEQWQHATDAMEQAIILWPASDGYRDLLGEYSTERDRASRFAEAQQAMNTEDWARVLALLDELPEDYKNAQDVRRDAEGRWQNALAVDKAKTAVREAIHGGDFSAAVRAAGDLLAVEPGDAEAQSLAAEAQRALERLEEEVRGLREAATASESLADWGAAVGFLQQLISLVPGDAGYSARLETAQREAKAAQALEETRSAVARGDQEVVEEVHEDDEPEDPLLADGGSEPSLGDAAARTESGRKRKRRWPWAIAALLLVAAGVAVWAFLFFYDGTDDQAAFVTERPTPTRPASTVPPPTRTTSAGTTPNPQAWVSHYPGVNLRAGPGDSHGVVDNYVQGTDLVVLGKSSDENWLKVQAPDGKVGWMWSEFLQLNVPLGSLPVAY